MYGQAYLEEIYNSSVNDELEKIAIEAKDQSEKRIVANVASLLFGLPAGYAGGGMIGEELGKRYGEIKYEGMSKSKAIKNLKLKKTKKKMPEAGNYLAKDKSGKWKYALDVKKGQTVHGVNIPGGTKSRFFRPMDIFDPKSTGGYMKGKTGRRAGAIIGAAGLATLLKVLSNKMIDKKD